ncbi:MAG: hypothetical protein H6831_01195 [Planctomycetes bacterium]|nr:hypothetical protein [Planctomycetota bacterium]MCB9903001.1 hypothetical protein [Planctomycetota bacterium]
MPRVSAALSEALQSASGILFLCSGNMIRSAFAELFARHLGIALPVRSAGTTYSNTRIHVETARALTARGVVGEWIREFRPRHMDDIEPAPRPDELVIGMTRAHLADARARGAQGPGRLMLEALGETLEIADPFFEGGFERTFAELTRCVEALVPATRRDA